MDEFHLLSIVGFIAGIVNATAGFGYGLISSTFLVFLSYSPLIASVVVNLSLVASSFSAFVAHAMARNIDWQVLAKLSIPGGAGGFAGAVLLSNLLTSAVVPWVATVSILLGLLIIFKFAGLINFLGKKPSGTWWVAPIGLVAGVFKATTGGGWGVIVGSSLLLTNSMEPKRVVGSTSGSEFFIVLSVIAGFSVGFSLRSAPWHAVVALVIGALIAGPLGAWLSSKFQKRVLGVLIGNLIVTSALVQLLRYSGISDLASITGILMCVYLLILVLVYGSRLYRRDVL